MNDQDKIELLKGILLDDERQVREKIEKRISELNDQVNQRVELEKRVNPIIEEKLGDFKEEIPKTMGPAITEALKNQIANAKDDIVDALYPILGQMIKKYIQAEFQKLSERIEKQRKEVFSFSNWKNRFKNKVSGIKEADIILEDLAESKIIDILVMEEGSGILLGSYNPDSELENDMVSGMLTAIKSFVEDAFNKANEDLEVIQYETYKLIINDYPKFNVVSIVEGPVTSNFKSYLEDQINIFASNLVKSREKNQANKLDSFEIKEFIRKELREIFSNNKLALN